MSFTPSFPDQEHLSKSLLRRSADLRPRERYAEIAVAMVFVTIAGVLIIADPPRSINWLPVIVSCAVMVASARVKFETPFGFTGATQIGFVPLLFAVPVALVPPAVAICLLLSSLPELLHGSTQPSRLLKWVGNASFAIGPAVVFAAAGTTPRHAHAGLLLVALLAQFTVDLSSSIMRAWLNGYDEPHWPRDELWIYVVDGALTAVGLLAARGLELSPWAPIALLPLLWLLGTFAHERSTRLQSLLELNETYRGTARVLGNVIEADDSYTGTHSHSVVELCMDVAAQLQLSVAQRRNLEFGALLHDIGKISIPKEILHKPAGLTLEEWTVMRTHTIEGQRLLDTVGGFMHEVGMIVRAHHERWDGTGYPDRLVRTEIPLEARIIAVCDAWNAMRTDRIYRMAMSHEQAVAELRASTGTQFDPYVVEALLAVVGDAYLPLVRVAVG